MMGSVKQILLSQGKYTVVDDEDYERFSCAKWYCSSHGYAVRTTLKSEKHKGHRFFLHREITNAPVGMSVDHINGDPLDNRRSNLRVCNHTTNQRNRTRINKNNTSGFRGVRKHSLANRWAAELSINGKTCYFGLFKTPEEASVAVEKARTKYWKD